jgi:subtilisin family serine protease
MNLVLRWWLFVITIAATICAAPLLANPSSALDRLAVREIVEEDDLSGKGNRIAVLSEAADLKHSLFSSSDISVWRFPSSDSLDGSQPEQVDPLLLPEEWHGTHVAGILVGSCDDALRGIACGATADVYDFGIYGDFFPMPVGSQVGEIEADFLQRMQLSFDHARLQGTKIANLSFNVEAPLISIKSSKPGAKSITTLIAELGVPPDFLFERRRELRANQAIILSHDQDWEDLSAIGQNHDDPSALILGLILPLSREWHQMRGAVARFQAEGGIVIISEANNRLMGRSGVLNTLPLQSEDVLASQWLSIVYVIERQGEFVAPLNTCGMQAQHFCMAVVANDVLSGAPEEDIIAKSGHSMAAPMASGLVAVMVEKGRRNDPGFSAVKALCLIRQSVRTDFPNYDPTIHGVGLLDAPAALRSVEEDGSECDD